jgi:hypothetical protein
MRPPICDGAAAGLVAGAVSGLPSTALALLRGEDPLEAARAAGALVLPRETRTAALLAAAVPVHLAISLGWGAVLARVLPRRRTVPLGAAAGLAIMVLDLGVVGRQRHRIRALRALPQLADHVAFGAGAAFVIERRRAAPIRRVV